MKPPSITQVRLDTNRLAAELLVAGGTRQVAD